MKNFAYRLKYNWKYFLSEFYRALRASHFPESLYNNTFFAIPRATSSERIRSRNRRNNDLFRAVFVVPILPEINYQWRLTDGFSIRRSHATYILRLGSLRVTCACYFLFSHPPTSRLPLSLLRSLTVNNASVVRVIGITHLGHVTPFRNKEERKQINEGWPRGQRASKSHVGSRFVVYRLQRLRAKYTRAIILIFISLRWLRLRHSGALPSNSRVQIILSLSRHFAPGARVIPRVFVFWKNDIPEISVFCLA